ncbi:MAG: DUF452 family protein, partial [Muribaculaceae bacterium]|nr:DUF452 family protein [Muribaculaceae bacterium]
GWGMTEAPFRHITMSGYDIAVAYDYPSEVFDRDALAGYRDIVVVAWSMGVMEAERILPHEELPVTLTIAINGTPRPVSDSEGIPVKIFRGTLDNLSEATLSRFNRRMCGGMDTYKKFNESKPDRSIESLREELSLLGQRALDPTPDYSLDWDVAVIGLDDMIFPATNQFNAWSNTRIIAIEAPHLPDFQSIINRLVVDKPRVAKRFGDTRQTYDISASIQLDVARKLARKLIKVLSPETQINRAIEIGAGDSRLTREYINRLNISDLELWDLTLPTAPQGASCRVTTVADDAEARLRELPDNSINLIVSSSTLQWFNSPIAALRQIQRILTPGGIAAIALYTEGTLARLAATTGISLNYVSEALLANAVKQPCVIEFIETETLRTDFDSTRKLLEHLRSTGVDGVGHAPSSSLRNLLRENSLLSLQFNSTTLIIRKQ